MDNQRGARLNIDRINRLSTNKQREKQKQTEQDLQGRQVDANVSLIFHVKVYGLLYEILGYKFFQDTILLFVKVKKVR